MMAISFIYYDTAERFSRNKEAYALIGFLLPILPILLGIMVLTISNLVLGHFPSMQVGETILMFAMIGYTLFVFMLPQFLSTMWGRSTEQHESYRTSSSEQAQAAEPREPMYHSSESRRGDVSGF